MFFKPKSSFFGLSALVFAAEGKNGNWRWGAKKQNLKSMAPQRTFLIR
jgi:hypothetical protein